MVNLGRGNRSMMLLDHGCRRVAARRRALPRLEPAQRVPQARARLGQLAVQPPVPLRAWRATMRCAKSRPRMAIAAPVAAKPLRISLRLPGRPKVKRLKSARAALGAARWQACCCRRRPRRRRRLDAAHRRSAGCAPSCRGGHAKPAARWRSVCWSQVTYVWRALLGEFRPLRPRFLILEAMPYLVNHLEVLLFVEVPHSAM